ncbi:MAG TPA: nuclear transport factor 2 family protein [Solirubrobacteraceae bacterium]|nr:nuclear transport factor 2 family protein [Solirubrobacteraceae bacterium]
MSRENVETVQRALDAMNHRDVDRYLTCCTDDVELQPPSSAIEGAYEGRAGIRRFFAEVEDTGPDFHLDADSIEAVGPNRVIAFLRATATGRASGAATSLPVTNVYDLADGRIRRVRVFQDRAAAIEATELPE